MKQWLESLAPARRANPAAQATINQNAARGVVNEAIALMDTYSKDETLSKLRAEEKALAASKPAL